MPLGDLFRIVDHFLSFLRPTRLESSKLSDDVCRVFVARHIANPHSIGHRIALRSTSKRKSFINRLKSVCILIIALRWVSPADIQVQRSFFLSSDTHDSLRLNFQLTLIRSLIRLQTDCWIFRAGNGFRATNAAGEWSWQTVCDNSGPKRFVCACGMEIGRTTN